MTRSNADGRDAAALESRDHSRSDPSSQFLANVFLDPLDHFVKEKLRVNGYVRYADDLRVFADSKEHLHAVRMEIESFLAGLRLVLHERKTVVAPTASGVPFLGFVLFPDGRRRLTRDGVRRFRRRLRRLARELEAGVIRPEDVTRSVRGWIAHAEHAQTLRLRRQLFKEVTFRCRPPSS